MVYTLEKKILTSGSYRTRRETQLLEKIMHYIRRKCDEENQYLVYAAKLLVFLSLVIPLTSGED